MKRDFFLALVLLTTPAWGQQQISNEMSVDSFVVDSAKNENVLDHLSQTHLFKATYIGVPLIAGGLIVKEQDSKFRRLRNDFMPEFHRSLDNYTQFAPAAVMLGLKMAGVQSRSSWNRMLLSDVFSTALMTSTVAGLKYSTNVTRPDGSNKHSFPSGHTAAAFMTATMLSKEYGHISPWVSVGAYSMATATGLMRMANSKHWLSDVMVGAGIGIISTEMGYWIADIIFKDKGLEIPEQALQSPIQYKKNPSFFGLYMGFNLPLSEYDLHDNNTFLTSTGTTLGIEGAYFLNRYIGIGGRTSISNLQYIINDNEAPENTFNFYSLGIGPYFSFPLTHRWSISSKLLIGEVWYPKTTVDNMEIRKNNGLMTGTGAAIDYQIRSRCVGSIFLDYNIQAPASRHSGEYMHFMTLGAKVSIRL